MSYVCAYSSVQLDKSRVEKEFTSGENNRKTQTGGQLDDRKFSDGWHC